MRFTVKFLTTRALLIGSKWKINAAHEMSTGLYCALIATAARHGTCEGRVCSHLGDRRSCPKTDLEDWYRSEDGTIGTNKFFEQDLALGKQEKFVVGGS